MIGASSLEGIIKDDRDMNSANWSKKREMEVVQAYLGDMKFQYSEVDIWLSGA